MHLNHVFASIVNNDTLRLVIQLIFDRRYLLKKRYFPILSLSGSLKFMHSTYQSSVSALPGIGNSVDADAATQIKIM